MSIVRKLAQSAYRMSLVGTAALLLLMRPLPIRSAAGEDFGQLNVRRERAKWPAPESVVRDLQSSSASTRLNALRLVGIPEKLARSSAAAGSFIVRPEQVELRYGALGADERQQAIVAAQVAGTYAFAAVAAATAAGWERIAVFDCWCKYDAGAAVDTFVSLHRAPDPLVDGSGRYELVLRASGGGTGMYTQNEVHFRLYRGELKPVMSFVSRVQSNPGGSPPPWSLAIERRWFHPSLPVTLPDGRRETVAVLVEGHAKTAVPPTVEFLIRELQDRHLKGITCRTFRWDQTLFRYTPVTVENACAARDQ